MADARRPYRCPLCGSKIDKPPPDWRTRLRGIVTRRAEQQARDLADSVLDRVFGAAPQGKDGEKDAD